LPGQPGVEFILDRKTEQERRIRCLNDAHVLKTLLVNLGHSFLSAGPSRWYVEGLDNVNGVTWATVGGHPSMIYCVPQGGASYPNNGARLVDTVDASPVERAAGLFERKVTKNRDAELDRYSCTKLAKNTYQAVRYAGKIAVTDGSFQKAAKAVVIGRLPDIENGVSATLIKAHTLDLAQTAAGLKDFPEEAWAQVPLTAELWPTRRWHNERMTATDAGAIKAYQKKFSREAEKALEDDVAQYRAQLRLKGA
jgi:hypothetical protein